MTFIFNGAIPQSFLKCVPTNSIQNIKTNFQKNCKRLDYNIGNQYTEADTVNIEKGCVECKPNFVGFIEMNEYTTTDTLKILGKPASLSHPYSHFSYQPGFSLENSSIQKSSFFSPWHKNLIFKCEEFRTEVIQTTANLKIFPFSTKDPVGNLIERGEKEEGNIYYENVKLISKYRPTQSDDEYVYITACNFGYKGFIVSTGLSENITLNKIPFIYNCEEFTQCNRNVFYTGLCNHDLNCDLHIFQSCSECSDSSNLVTIPYALTKWTFNSVKTNSDGKYSIPDDQTNQLEITENFKGSNECAKPGLEDHSFVDNCAVQLVLPGLLVPYSQGSAQLPNPVCVACKPQYKPTLSNTTPTYISFKYIINCDFIQFCVESLEYNKCQQCLEGYVLKYDSTGGEWQTFAEECVVSGVEGCQVGEAGGQCKRCREGFILNESGLCDLVMVNSNCEQVGNLQKHFKAYEYLHDDPFILGCLACKDGQRSVSFDFVPQFCVLNNSIGKGDALSISFQIPHCLQYKSTNGKLHCSKCDLDYYTLDDQSECVQETQDIKNCEIFKRKSNDTQNYECFQCKSEYVLTNGSCSKGKIEGCLTYNNNENCIECNTGKIATRIDNNKYTICMDIENSVIDCLEFSQNDGYKGVLSCQRCSESTFPKFFDLAIKTCSKFPTIQNCESYSIGETFQETSFFCNKCNNKYYTNNFHTNGDVIFPSTCESRTLNYPVLNCNQYEISQDKCKNCFKNFFLSTIDGLNHCVPNPTGIQNCRIFKEKEFCLECDSGYYPSNGKCLSIPAPNLITNCFTYRADLTCSMCDKSFELFQGTCKSFTLTNCEIQGFNNQCEKCSDNFHNMGGECRTGEITNCQVFNSPSICQICSEGYYLQNDKCFQPTPIDFCLQYSDQKDCAKCEPGKVLVKNPDDLDLCNSRTQEDLQKWDNVYCEGYQQLESCVVCEQGFFIGDSLGCEKCAASNCSYCDPIETEQCLICLSGFFMNKEKKCIANLVDEGVLQGEENVQVSRFFTPKEGSGILMFGWIILVVLLQ